MKKTLLVLSLLAGSLAFNAQEFQNFEDYYQPRKLSAAYKNTSIDVDAIMSKRLEQMKNNGHSKTNIPPLGTYHEILNHTAVIYNIYGGQAGGNFVSFIDPIFMDSTVNVSIPVSTGSPTGLARPTIKLGGILDPKSTDHFSTENGFFTDDKNFVWAPYTVDTVFLTGVYDKIDTTSIADTLQMEIMFGTPVSLVGTASTTEFLRLTTGTGSSQQTYNGLKHTASSSHGNTSFLSASIPAASKRIVKYPLTKADTASDIIAIPVDPPFSVPANKVVGAAITFVPGYTFTPGDIYFNAQGTATATINSFRALLLQEADAFDQSGNYTGSNRFYDKTSAGLSHSLNYFARYGKYTVNSTGGDISFLNTTMSPAWYEGYDIAFAVNTTITGINEQQLNNLKLWDNFPNPVQGNTAINYELTESGVVNLSVYDITGKKVMGFSKGKQAAGLHQILLDASNLEAGIYFYTLNVNDESSLTKKMTVVK